MSVLKMTKLLFGALIKGPSTTISPIEKRVAWSRTRGQIEIDIENCIFCGLCMRKCVTGAIQVNKPQTTWEIDRLRCVQCGLCSDVCPKKCLKMSNTPFLSVVDQQKAKEMYKHARIPDNKPDNQDS